MGEVKLPALGESVTEGTVTRWLKRVGDTVAQDEPLVEISTDKVDTEIPSPFAGTLQEILVGEDETVAVGTILAIVADGSVAPATPAAPSAQQVSADAPATVTPVAASPATSVADQFGAQNTPATTQIAPPAATPAPQVLPSIPTPAVASPATPSAVAPTAVNPSSESAVSAGVSSPVDTERNSADAHEFDSNYITPIVRKLAQDSGVDLTAVQGTGVGGRIRKEDVLLAAEAKSRAATPPPSPVVAAASTSAPTVAETSIVQPQAVPTIAVPTNSGVAGEPMSRLRRVLAERAVASMQQTAQLTSVVEADVTNLAKLRDEVKERFLASTGLKLSFMPFFTLAAADALTRHPKINCSVDGDRIVFHQGQNLSFAVDTERGLLTPVIRQAAQLSVAQLAAQIADLAARTRSNQLKPDELSGGTFTITNTGSRGALFDTPIVFLPQVAILGTGVVVKRPAVVSGADGSDVIAIRSSVYLALSYDHRVIDGADAARYLNDVKDRLEAADFRGQLGV